VPSLRKCTIDAVFVEDKDNGPVVSCEWCRTPIHEGEARLRFFAIAYHSWLLGRLGGGADGAATATTTRDLASYPQVATFE
jgi:hypothetical protein